MYTYTWSNAGQLLAERTQGIATRIFTYTAAGQLAETSLFTLTTHFSYNGDGARRVVNIVGRGVTTYTLDYAAGNRILAEQILTGTTLYLYGHDCLGEYTSTWLYYLPDASGYVRQGTDSQGQVASAWTFDPDGTVLIGPQGPVSHLVCGGVYDWSTGLIYKGGRYFDPSLGIWLVLTPLMVVQSWRRRRRRRQGVPWYLFVLCIVAIGGTLVACGGSSSTPPPTPCTWTPPPPPPFCKLERFWLESESWQVTPKVNVSKNVEFRFKVTDGKVEDCALVNFLKGNGRWISTGQYGKIQMLGQIVDDIFPDWHIDSADNDPIYWSNNSSRWNYNKIDANTASAQDAPNALKGYRKSMEYKMCIYRTNSVPTVASCTNAKTLMAEAIECIDWEAKVTHKDDGTITYP